MARILIADDSDAIRLVLKDILSIGEHEIVAEGCDGAEAVDLYQKHNPDSFFLIWLCQKKMDLLL